MAMWVADEGMDVPAANSVIRFDVVQHSAWSLALVVHFSALLHLCHITSHIHCAHPDAIANLHPWPYTGPLFSST